jgi:transposase-like protein
MSRNGRIKGQHAPESALIYRRAMAMLAAGATTNQIRLAIGVPRQTVNEWIRRAKCPSK